MSSGVDFLNFIPFSNLSACNYKSYDLQIILQSVYEGETLNLSEGINESWGFEWSVILTSLWRAERRFLCKALWALQPAQRVSGMLQMIMSGYEITGGVEVGDGRNRVVIRG